MNKDIYGHSCNNGETNILGENLTGSHHFSFSKDQIKTFTFMNTGVHFIKKVTS
jgi:hypothetical protein